MIGLDYFLDKKWFKKTSTRLKEQPFTSILPGAVQEKFHWEFRTNFFRDRYLYDYTKAYLVDAKSSLARYFRYQEIISILFLDGNLKTKNPKVMFKKLTELNNNRLRPTTRDERLLENVLQIYDLIYQTNFPFNEENFELVISILYRNMGYDMDRHDSFKRSSASKTPFKHLLDPVLIDTEMQNLWKYVKENDKNNFSGFSEAFHLGLEILYISPFDSLNIILMQFVIKWYLFQLDQEFVWMNFSYFLGINFEEFIKVVDTCFGSDFSADEFFHELRNFSKDQINMTKRYWYLEKLKERRNDLTKILNNTDNCLVIISLMSFSSDEFSVLMCQKKYFFLRDNYFSEEELQTKIDLLVEHNVIKVVKVRKKETLYTWLDPDFQKISDLLED